MERNPFGYHPWRDNRSFNSMFNILEADIVIFQETKIQRKDLRDDMVLVPGWDCYFSLPRHKKGYSGVVIYTRNEVCAPIRAEEGITGLLCPPSTTTPYRHLPDDQQIGGYPSMEQLNDLQIDPAVLDCEGRCVILEFPAFVLFGLYCPAARDETRDHFRQGFITLLDARIRNLVAMGKRVIVTGDLNISAGEIDSAHLTEAIRKGTGSEDEFVSGPVRRVFNQLVEGAKVIGKRDSGREVPVLHDICRSFHPDRRGMYTCWETRVNARPGNYGARIDYILSSLDIKDWWSEGNIQEGLMGSDHCPVYAVFKERVSLNGNEIDIKDIVNPPGMFENGIRQREYSTKDLLPLSGRLIPEFTQRRSIKDMFTRKPSSSFKENNIAIDDAVNELVPVASESASTNSLESFRSPSKSELYRSQSNSERASNTPPNGVSKRVRKESAPAPPPKRSKSGGKSDPNMSGKGQQSLMGFFKPKKTQEASASSLEEALQSSRTKSIPSVLASPQKPVPTSRVTDQDNSTATDSTDETVIDPIVSKESWSKLFTKKAMPRCEDHQEPCIMLTTKKAGINCGRSFWMCSRPLGPTGQSEKGTQWRCKTFIWASDWNGQE
ncbi:DNA lyase Apn2 [Talaromyces marneffei ATCC 18224]|uniref:DNA-(apurinic or apyrimidinic site) endonuclease 2 n=2 Tax=Talaromyces marneffei TaxID=37727 RepID=B6QT95_TALMQ|nr:DNA lyase Apn2 [Talaromyces marneffei ATCC 18224]